MKIIRLAFIATLFVAFTSFADKEKPVAEKIQWLSFQEAIELNKQAPKKLFVDVYTDWCGWCKVMDSKTFTDPTIIKYINKYYYAVKFNAEGNDTIVFNKTTFVNPNPGKRSSTHQFAAALLNYQMSYPTTVYMDETFNMLCSPVQGYLKPNDIEPILAFFGENHHINREKYDDFVKTFKPQSKN